MNKKAQGIAGIISFVLLIFLIIFSLPIIMKTTTTALNQTAIAMSPINNNSVNAISFASTKFASMLDWVIFLAFIGAVVVLLVTSFLVDIHPAFFVVYVLAMLAIVLIGPMFMPAMDAVWGSSTFATEAGNMPIMGWLEDHFIMVMVGVMVISGLIMFGKYRLGSANMGGTGGTY